jgi:hypothetical protein
MRRRPVGMVADNDGRERTLQERVFERLERSCNGIRRPCGIRVRKPVELK